MTRLKMELEQIHGEERHEAIQKVHEECLRDMNDLKDKFNQIEQDLRDEVNPLFKLFWNHPNIKFIFQISSLKKTLNEKGNDLLQAHSKSDTQMAETRMFLQRTERDSQIILNCEIEKREQIIG